ncbi:MAG: 1-acyl-sn-glycerol-3-phosphate acyltransferase [Candidatus Binatia bacterium]
MAEGDRTGEADGARPRLRAFRGGATVRAGWQPRELARRLATLEQQVESALEGRGAAGVAGVPPVVGEAIDEALAGYARLRRWLFGDVGEVDGGLPSIGLRALYRYWWRVDARGLERIPDHGRVLIVANRSAALLPYDALMLPVALALDHPTHRRVHPLVDERLIAMPLIGALFGRLDALTAAPGTLRRLLQDEEAVIVFPEGRVAATKPFGQRYRVGRFGRPSALRVAIETGTPIVPVGVIGAEETQPVLARVGGLERLGIPPLPVTPTFPWLGPWGLLPLPTKWTIHAGDALDVAAEYPAGQANDPAAVRRLRDQVRERLQGVVSEGLRRRRGLFSG